MKKTFISVATAVILLQTTSGIASAHYPPIDEVKASTVVKEIWYDRIPATVPSRTRKIESSIAVGGTKLIRAFRHEVFTIVVTNCRPNVKFQVTISNSLGQKLTLPHVVSTSEGRLQLPSLAMVKPGTYTVKTIAPNGNMRTIRVDIA